MDKAEFSRQSVEYNLPSALSGTELIDRGLVDPERVRARRDELARSSTNAVEASVPWSLVTASVLDRWMVERADAR